MKKGLVLTVFLAGILVGCDKESPELSPIPEPEEPVYLSIYPILRSFNPISRGVIKQFKNDDRLGLFITKGEIYDPYENMEEYSNISATFNGKEWVHKSVELVEDAAQIFSYYPYNKSISQHGLLSIDLKEQIDILYGDPVKVNKNALTANLKMNHALALTSFIIKKNDYQYAGKVSSIELMEFTRMVR